ncbi:MAG: DUF362 domain-containing protein [Promethearchaeota archaeon]|nr:MAG: DUF362 domain-containing protein [Candidatus Lokiarchaeota archaeon]
MSQVFITETTNSIKNAVEELFAHFEKNQIPVLKSSKKVYIKVNGIDFKKHCYTSPEVLEEVINYLQQMGAEVYVMENSTQSNMTRVVFAVNGMKKVCKKAGAKIIYLDEESTEKFEFKGKPSNSEDSRGYRLKEFRLPQTIINIMENRDLITYIDIPKLKTHSMAGVTLGIKNQWGYPQHADRGVDHNYNLHSKLVDVYEYIQPDLTIIDGTEGTIHGHYPPTAFEDELVIPFNILIGGKDTVAVDAVGARIFGLTMDDVPHLKIAHERGLGIADLNRIKVIGKDLGTYDTKYEWDLLQRFPEDVKLVKGKDLLCREGCQNNPLALLQVLAYDYPEKFRGGWFIVMGKGHDEGILEQLKKEGYTKGLVAGFCAIEEVGDALREAFGKKNVFFSGTCNNLAQTATAMFKLSGVSVLDLVPVSTLKLAFLLISAKLHGSKALIPSIF